MRCGLRSAGVDPPKSWPSSRPCAQGGLVGTERVSAPSGLFGFLAPGGRRQARRGDFNFVAANENALCKEIAPAASVGEGGWPGPAVTGMLAAPPPHPVPVRACEGVDCFN